MKLDVQTGETSYTFNNYINWYTAERLQFPQATAGDKWQGMTIAAGGYSTFACGGRLLKGLEEKAISQTCTKKAS